MSDKLILTETNPATNETNTFELALKNVFKQCAECKYKVTDMGKRECACVKCGHTRIFVVGRDEIKDDMSVMYKKS